MLELLVSIFKLVFFEMVFFVEWFEAWPVGCFCHFRELLLAEIAFPSIRAWLKASNGLMVDDRSFGWVSLFFIHRLPVLARSFIAPQNCSKDSFSLCY